MAERGARPHVSAARRRMLKAASVLFTPLLPDDYLELVNPLWSTRELRGRIERVQPERGGAVTVLIKPGWDWPGHRPGQYLRVGVVVDGRHHWRAYSLTSDPGRADGFISVTPKLVDGGVVSTHFVEQAKPGAIVRLGGVEGAFCLPDPPPAKLLFISAGSGITPIMSMLRDLDHRDLVRDVVHIHSARDADDVIFGDELRAIAARHDGMRLHEQHTGEHGRMGPADLDDLCPDWRERESYVSGPPDLLEALLEHYEAQESRERVHVERFQPREGPADVGGDGGTITFKRSGTEATAASGQAILVAGEEAGLELPFGCRMGICHTCIGRLCEGRIRDLRSGEVSSPEGEMVRTCIHAPEGAVTIEL